ncbi:MAG: response regulator transcription factor [Burkholderiaceae bacterium]
MAAIRKNESVKIVIADDDSTTRYVLRLLLQEQLYTVVGEAVDGEKAVELCALHKPNIAFIDIHMPVMNGHEASQQIRKQNPHTSIIMISALSTLDNVRQAMEAGASGFVVKPFSAVKLTEAINNCLKKQQ